MGLGESETLDGQPIVDDERMLRERSLGSLAGGGVDLAALITRALEEQDAHCGGNFPAAILGSVVEDRAKLGQYEKEIQEQARVVHDSDADLKVWSDDLQARNKKLSADAGDLARKERAFLEQQRRLEEDRARVDDGLRRHQGEISRTSVRAASDRSPACPARHSPV
jgi:hypothetical protein